MVVVERRPWLMPVVISVWLLSVVIIATLAGVYFSQKARNLNSQLALENNQLARQMTSVQSEADQLISQVAALKAAAEIDRAAAEQSRQNLVAEQNKVQQLQAEISFYRSLMDPSGKRKGVNLGSAELFNTAQPNRVRYVFVVQQVAANHKRVSGFLQVNIRGRLQGQDHLIPLAEISEQVAENSLKLKFKYFQTIEGELVLPDGFQPEWLEWQLDSSVSGKISGKLAWQTKEVTYVW